MTPDVPPAGLAARVADLLKRRPVAWRRTTGGYTTAERWVITFDDGESVFVKSGAGRVATFLRAEHELVYSRMQAPFLPTLVAWKDDGIAPLLVLEDLSRAHWPPPWLPGHVEAVLEALEELQFHARVLSGLQGVEEAHADATLRSNWANIEGEPGPFLSLDLCTCRMAKAGPAGPTTG